MSDPIALTEATYDRFDRAARAFESARPHQRLSIPNQAPILQYLKVTSGSANDNGYPAYIQATDDAGETWANQTTTIVRVSNGGAELTEGEYLHARFAGMNADGEACFIAVGGSGGSSGSGGCCGDESNTEYHPDDNPLDNTFEIRRAFGAGAATTSDLDCRLIGDFVGGRLAADTPDWTHVLICEADVDIRDGCTRVVGSNALTYADGDEVRVPSGASSPRFVVVWVECVNKGESGPDLYEYKRVFLMRHTA